MSNVCTLCERRHDDKLRNDSAKTLELLKKKRFANALGAHKELGMVSKVAKPSSHIVLRLLDGSPN